MLRAAGIVAELHILEAAPHGGFMANTPEDEDLEQEGSPLRRDVLPIRAVKTHVRSD